MKDIIKKNPILTAFKLAFGGMFGVMAAEALVFLFTFICIIIGVAIIVHFGTDKEKEDIEKEEKLNTPLLRCVLEEGKEQLAYLKYYKSKLLRVFLCLKF